MAPLLAACLAGPLPRPDCPAGSVDDSARRTAILRFLSSEAARDLSPPPRACFAPDQGRGVLAGGVALLDPRESDAELAAQLAHLSVHHSDRLGDGCARGLAAALDSERRAHKAESAVRERLALPSAPRSPLSAADYQARCRR
jgi:hypothetical protein